ncbi:hypothetical protein FNO01nite_31220 [Flavobacterium noncentrifugens]|uniref:Delta-60 repeat domain-containing protein/Por secretion system C-terminal sorting domain-containing protein n=1 Tax=Flavobacterium noncentrifugens TaxID=1128970 RepID=A0A1G9BIL3_9FLAO|nr:T9SS type A sorting domain-containing protein [Flavobacterium noncentrifugens]GEP52450.1 hypothetical protein FNO01nite_31220 [Flavobacterium noncentrifugens]SDK38695.1 delta-60 repeat domain-containing protein/Por secretion system C-terminal sorting domain-containing protein [Flavobacterium noncentrifugens]
MKILYYALILLCANLSAQTIDATFNPGSNETAKEYIGRQSAPLQSGKFLTIYSLYDVGDEGISKIIRITENGSIDNTFTPIEFGESDSFFPSRIFMRPDDSFVVTSSASIRSYTASGQLTANFINPSFETTATTGQMINDLVFQTDGKMILSGQFTIVNGIAKRGLVRLNLDGSIDATFNPSGTGLYGSANQAVVQENGKIVVCGNFHSYNGVAKHHILRLNADGTIDSSFDVPYIDGPFGGFQKGIKDPIRGIAVQADGKIIPVGAEMYENYTVFYNIVRLNANGTRDIKFDDTTNTIATNYVTVKSDGSIWTKGGSYVAKYNSNGIRDISFLQSTVKYSESTNGGFYFIGDKVVVNSDYWDVSGITRDYIFRLNANGSIDKTFNPGYGFNKIFHNRANRLNQDAIVSKILKDGKIFVSGNFSSYNDVGCPSVIRLTRDGSIDPTFVLDPGVLASNTGQDNQTDNQLIQQQPDGKLILGRSLFYSTIAGITGTIRLNENGSIDLPFSLAVANIVITSYLIQPDGKIVINSGFSIRRLNGDGSIDTTFNGPTDANGYSIIELQKDGKILVAGLGSTGGWPYLKRLNADGSPDNTMRTINRDPFNAVKVQPDGKILIFSGTFGKRISRVNEDGTEDTTFNEYVGDVLPINVFENGQILLISAYNWFNLESYRSIIILNSDGTFSHSFVNKSGYFGVQDCSNLIFWSELRDIDNSGKDYMLRYNINDIISAIPPDGPLHFSFTQGQTLLDIHVQGQNIQWYASQSSCMMENSKSAVASSPSTLDPNTPLVNGKTYYASQIINNIESLYRLPVTVELSLNTNNNPDASYFKTFPNPVKETFNIAAKENIEQIEVYNTHGMLLDSKNYSSNSLQIDFSNRGSGIYFVTVRSEHQSQTIKVIKN